MEILGMLVLGREPGSENRLGAARHLLCWWSIFTLLATTAYSSGLVSHLTVPSTAPAVDTVQSLVEEGFHWGLAYLPYVDNIFDPDVSYLILLII